MRFPRITEHAVERYISRVDTSAPFEEARSSVARIITGGRVRSTPRHWMRSHVRTTPGLRYVYCCEQPDVCALVLGGAVVTILTHDLCRRPHMVTEDDGRVTRAGNVVRLDSYRHRLPDWEEAA